jgi:polyhydroxyalkanoate synthesis regulator phasin
MMMNPGLGGPENRYGGKELDAEDYKALNTVTKNTLRMAGLDPDIDPVKNLSNANPMVKMYYADFYDPASDKFVTNTEESRVEQVGKFLVKNGEIKTEDYQKIVNDIQKHWEEGTEPAEVQQMLDSTKVDESVEINNLVKFLKFEHFKNSINNK